MDKINFITVLISVSALVILMVPGYILSKTGILKAGADTVLSALVLYGCQPVLVFMSFQKEYDAQIAINMLIVAGIALAVHLVMIGLTYLIIRDKGDRMKRNCVRFASVFGNCAYMGIPFLQTLFAGSSLLGEAIIYCAVVVTIFNILTWSIGVFMITGDKKQISVKNAFLNPTIIATVLGIIYFITVRKPLTMLAEGQGGVFLTKLSDSLNSLGNTVTPLAMVLIGIKLTSVKPKELFLDKWGYISSGFKLVVMGFIAMLAVGFLNIDPIVKYTLFFTLSMPTATSTVMFAVQFGGDGKSASVYVLLSTLLSIVVIPLMYLCFTAIFPM